VFQLFKRLLTPLLILAILITLLNTKDRFGYEEVSTNKNQIIGTNELTTPLFSLRRTPELLTSPLATQQLEEKLEELNKILPDASCFSIAIGNESLYNFQEGIPLNPGGAQKIITAYAALKQMGSDYQYETIISADRETDEDGNLLSSDLYIFGGGDPLIRTDAFMELLPESFSDIRTSADGMADLTVGMNILFIQGAVVVNESRYDEERTIAGWGQELKGSSSIGSLSASLLDAGFDGLKQNYSQQRGENPAPLVPSINPAKSFAANFDDLLEARGVIILRGAKEINNVDQGSLVELLTIKSPALDQIIKQMLNNDDDVTAEMILKEIGKSRTGQGSTGSGLVSIPEILSANNLPSTGLLLIDGSGLSTDNQATCNVFQGILQDNEHGETLKMALPLVGSDGIVSDILAETPFSLNLVAHSDFRNGTGALVGVYTMPNGIEINLSYLANYSSEEGSELIHQTFLLGLSQALSDYTGGQPLAGLGPVTGNS
jgi:D-alanyl-D-alanine carboxypeptidase/D-alanyl-D-alanine-endopeptidase (penicillin-binding protein 4)